MRILGAIGIGIGRKGNLRLFKMITKVAIERHSRVFFTNFAVKKSLFIGLPRGFAANFSEKRFLRLLEKPIFKGIGEL